MGILKDNTQARREATEAMRAIDGNGHVPDDAEECEAPGECAECIREAAAARVVELADKNPESREAVGAALRVILESMEELHALASAMRDKLEQLAERPAA